MHIRRPRAMRESVGRAGCALAAAARAGVGGAGRPLARGCCRTATRASVGRAGCALAAAARCASIGHACCARLLRALRTRARARAETGSGKGVRARGAYTRARLARRMTATMMASGPASGERTIMTVLPRLLREVCRRALRARTRAKESVRGTLKPHSQAARSSRTLKPHAQAARSSTAFARQLAAPFWRTTRIVAADRWLPSVRERQKHAEVRSNPIWPARSNRVRQVPRDVLSMRLIW